MSRIPARLAIRQSALSVEGIYKTMRQLFPKSNDFGDASFHELVPELSHLGIQTIGQFELLMKRQRRRLLEIDASPMNSWHVRYYSSELGHALVHDHVRRNFWFAYPALVRMAAELQFGETAVEAASKEISKTRTSTRTVF